MKLLLVLLVALGVSQAAVTCDECQAAAQDFVSHLLSEESLAEQVQIMKDNVCPQVLLLQCILHLTNTTYNDSWVWTVAKAFWICGTPIWHHVSSTISSWKAMPAPWPVCATKRAPWLR